jgi:hypothetical protein
MLIDIIEAKPVGGHRIYIRFEDGMSGEVDLNDLVELNGVFEPLRDPEEVAKVRVEPDSGTVCWPNGADLDPDVLYAAVSGRPIEMRSASAM